MKNMKKLASLLLALVMVFSLAATAFAAETATTTLTIKTVAGHTYKVYQLLTGEVTNLSNGTGTLSNTKVGQDALAGPTVDDIDAALKDDDGNYLSGAALGDAAYALINIESITAVDVVGNGDDMSVNVAPGYYVVVDSWTEGAIEGDALSRYLVAVVGDTTMTPKVSKPEIDKDIIDNDANAPLANSDNKVNTAAIGDTINFEITGTVPNTEGYKYYYYVVNDTLSKGLDLVQDSFVVTVGGDTLTKDTDYYVYVTPNADGTTSFQLAFADMKGKTAGAAISIKYNATINDNAAIGLDPNTNTAKLEYSNNPGKSTQNDVDDKPGVPKPGTATGEGPAKVTNTYVTELTILKVDNEGKALAGAEFTLSGDNLTKVIVNTEVNFEQAAEGTTGEYYLLKNGTYTKTAPSSAAEGEEGYNANLYDSTTPDYVLVTTVFTSSEAISDEITATTTEEGYIVFTGLNAGDYTLTETVTPEGYNTIAPITFKIAATADTDGSITWNSSNDAIVLDGANGVFDATIVNVPGTNLPTTGGMGTTLFYVFGGILVAAAVVLLVTKKRMSTAE